MNLSAIGLKILLVLPHVKPEARRAGFPMPEMTLAR